MYLNFPDHINTQIWEIIPIKLTNVQITQLCLFTIRTVNRFITSDRQY
jgi:hypothetical protein